MLWWTALLQYCAKATQANFHKFLGFLWLFEEMLPQTKLLQLFCKLSSSHYFIPPKLMKDNLHWTLTSGKILRESFSFQLLAVNF